MFIESSIADTQHIFSISAQNCYTPNLLPGMCLSYKYCDHIIQLIYKYYQTQDITIAIYIQNTLCGYDNEEPLVCCPIQTTTTTTPAPYDFYFGHAASIAPAPTLAPSPSVSNRFQLLTNEANKCGMSNASHLRVVGGVNAALNGWPWMAALGYKSSTDFTTRFLCGGSLITTFVNMLFFLFDFLQSESF
jgi:hypothetical protein